MLVSAIFARLFRGRSIPAMRAMCLLISAAKAALQHSIRTRRKPCLQQLPLPLLVFGIGADHPDHPTAVNDLALITNLLDRCSYLHNLILFCPMKTLRYRFIYIYRRFGPGSGRTATIP